MTKNCYSSFCVDRTVVLWKDILWFCHDAVHWSCSLSCEEGPWSRCCN